LKVEGSRYLTPLPVVPRVVTKTEALEVI
jgi:hypothetical protein